MKPKVLVTRKIFPETIALLEKRFDLETNQRDLRLSPAQLRRKLRGKQGAITLLTDRIDDALLAACPGLKIVANVAVGYNNIDVEACTKRGVMATNTPGVLDDTTADFAWTLLLAAARRLVEADRYFRSGKWEGWGLMQFVGHDIHHKTLGTVGLGRIGRKVAERAKGFQMRVLYTDVKPVDRAIERQLGAEFVDKKTILREADFLTIHIPLFPETRHWLSDDDFALMKPSAVLVNAARGPIVDEKALVRALKAKRIAAAGLDVYEREPLCEKALLKMPNVALAPHIASASIDTRLKMAMMAAENVVAGLDGRRPPNLLNFKAFKP